MNNIKGILRETLRIYGENFSRLLAIVAIVQVVLTILLSLFNLTPGKIESVYLLSPILIVNLVYAIVAIPLMVGALIHAVSEIYLHRTIDIGRAYRFAWQRLGALIGGLILPFLALLGIFAGMSIITMGIAAAMPRGVKVFVPIIIFCTAVYFLVRWFFIFQVILLEHLSPIVALSRSSALVKGNWWRVFGNLTVVGIMTGFIGGIFGIIPVVGSIIGTILATPIFPIESTLLYYDLRIRKEEYSVDSLKGELNIRVTHDKGPYDKAISDFTKTLEINPDDAIAYYNRGVAHWHKGQYDQAIFDYNKALEINPGYAEAYYNRGVANAEKSLYDQAISDFNKALKINSRYAKVYYNRGVVYYLKKEYDKSWEDVNSAQDLGYEIPAKFLENLRKASGRQN